MTAVDWTTLIPAWLPEAITAGLIVTDAELMIRHWCPWLERHSGIPAAALLGRPLLEAFPELVAHGMEPVFRRALAGEPVELPHPEHGYLLALPPPVQTTVFANMQQRARVAPLHIGGVVVGTISTITDLTERALEAEEARRAQAECEAALRMRDTFFSLAAHELRTPLTTLLGRAQLLQKWVGRDDDADNRTARSVGVLVDQAQRLNQMIGALLDVSRIQSGRFSISRVPLDLVELVRRVAEELVSVPPTHQLRLVLPDESLRVSADRPRLEQVLQSLIGNAMKYSPSGGEVQVRVTARDGMARVEVSDQGIGVPASAHGELFRRYYRADNAERLGISGLGIALFVAREILELHGGRIDVESAEGQGSTFSAELPVA